MYFYCPYFLAKLQEKKNGEKIDSDCIFRGQKRDLKFPILHKSAIIGMENDDTISTESVFPHKNRLP